ncbi:hypothetical protein A4G99_16630 [Haladaptatus sp. R4]|nr:hypothetical protein A4G99_16630 [Haladaptatus sp. R4]
MEKFWKVVCATGPAIKIALNIIIVLILLSIYSFLIVSPDTGSYYLTLANITILVILLVFVLYSIWRCDKLSDIENG